VRKDTDLICPKCNNSLKPFRQGYTCSNRNCAFWVPREIRQRMLSEEIVKELITEKETGVIHGFHKRGYSQTFAARLYITDEWKIKIRLADETDFQCPRCKGKLLRFESGYKCINENDCSYVLWNYFGGKKLTEEQINTLLTEKRTEIIKGFISRKNGKKYSARIVMGDKGNLRFEFEKTALGKD
jgi:DNA topoisomerase-1/DNA topoisomerase-3